MSRNLYDKFTFVQITLGKDPPGLARLVNRAQIWSNDDEAPVESPRRRW